LVRGREERRGEMRGRDFISMGLVFFLLLGIGVTAEAASAKFPVEVSFAAGSQTLIDTEIYVINLKNTQVKISFSYYGNNGTKGNCPIPPSITIEANDTWSFRVGGCFAASASAPPFTLLGIGEISTASKSVGVYWRIYDVSGDKDLLLDHGKESP
jgi:hypothetical protein